MKAKGKVRNLGAGGLFVLTRAIPEEGQDVMVSMKSPTGATVRVRGLVWWTTASDETGYHRNPGFGMRVVDAGRDYTGLVQTLLTS